MLILQIKAADDSASNQIAQRLGFGAYPVGPGECSLRDCRKTVLQQIRHSLNGHEDGVGGCIENAVVPYPENGCMSLVKVNYFLKNLYYLTHFGGVILT